ncbi:Uma2 family endonuclease [Neorhodopirellula pilleata]|uniref:Putative restriction endonuclease domain-containing protein n=1 Tax=Neorhodopirellula pilleata TaxID=2714738 RepID=A0A5C6A6G3_9BACT|nr:Uma2 family endonuclease [Neorhodopirellula pilleata]TWT95046.1 hypothetical protein Pla100_36250 [Neorhodopirellula pilleata]
MSETSGGLSSKISPPRWEAATMKSERSNEQNQWQDKKIRMSQSLRLTADEYGEMVQKGAFDHLHGKIELIRGEIRCMNPAGPIHDDFILYLTNWSFTTTAQRSIQVAVQIGLGLPEFDSRPEPDVYWVRAARYRERHPSAADVKLVIEIADSSLKADLIEKVDLYAKAMIVECWVVDLQGQCVHVFRKPENGRFNDRSVAKAGESLSPLEPCNVPLDLADLFGP